MSDAVLLFVTFVPRVGAEDATRETLRNMVAPSRAERGNERYELCESDQGGYTRFHLIEQYGDKAALDAHRRTVHYEAYRAAIIELLASPIDVVRMRRIE